MSTRAKIASATAAAGILVTGWQIGTVNGDTVDGAAPAASTDGSESTTPPSVRTGSTQSRTTGSASTLTGETVSHRFGTVTVSVTLTSGRITALSERVVSDGHRKSERINDQAIPILRQRILAAGDADVSTVSGATYTTEAYLTSLQSALDKAS